MSLSLILLRRARCLICFLLPGILLASFETRVSLTFANLARNRYSVESREGLHTGHWTTQAVLPPSEASGPRTVTFPQTTPNLFYRIAWYF